MSGPADFWLFLSTSPLFWLALTLGAYVGADALAARTSRHPAVNPVLLTILGVGAVLLATGTDQQTYFAGAQFINVLLGPATVAFAVPILRHRSAIRRNLPAIAVTLAAGTTTGVVSAVLLAKLFGGGRRWSLPWRRNPSRRRSPWAFRARSAACRSSPPWSSSRPASPAPSW